jgi:hypothetical protein
MRILIFCFCFFLVACTESKDQPKLPAAIWASDDPHFQQFIAESGADRSKNEQDLADQKNRLFKILLEKGQVAPEANSIRLLLANKDMEYTLAQVDSLRKIALFFELSEQKKYVLLNALVPELSETMPAPKVELDMFVQSQDLQPAEKESLLRVYEEANKELTKLRLETGKVKSGLFEAAANRNATKAAGAQHELVLLQKTQSEISLQALEKIADILHRSTLDRDYAYRAILREQRRNSLGFLR